MRDVFDLFLFTGQSNMAGRGIVNQEHPEEAPSILDGAGYEYRAVTSPDCLHVLSEPFGVDENRVDGIDDSIDGAPAKTGSMVTSFANEYFLETGVPVIGISASKGRSSISEWCPGEAYYLDMMDRLESFRNFASTHDIRIRHSYVLFAQGERDSRLGTSSEEYERNLISFWNALKQNAGMERLFIVAIGCMNRPGQEHLFDRIRNLQKDIASRLDDIFIVSDSFKDMLARGLMKDELHYYQEAYNFIGREAASKIAELT